MKRYQNTLTTIIILQVIMVTLLGAMAVFTYRNQSAVHQLRNDVARIQERWGQDKERTVAERLAALELRTGMRDPAADEAAAALQQQLAEANALKRRFDALRDGGAPDSASLPPSPVPAEREVSPPSMLEGLTPSERAVAQLPIAAEIKAYDADWNFFTLDRGQLAGLQEGQEFGVRKNDDHTIVARLKISRLHPDDAIAEVIKGSQKQGMPAPAPGDVLIDLSKLQ